MPRRYSNLRGEGNYNTEDIAKGKRYKIYVDVENLGDKPIDEIVCMYISANEQPVMRRIKELADFKRVSINPGQKITVELSLGKEAISYFDWEGKQKIGPGRFTVSVGVNPDEELKVELFVDGEEISVK